MAKGDRVMVHSLIEGAHLNGCVGFVQSNGGRQEAGGGRRRRRGPSSGGDRAAGGCAIRLRGDEPHAWQLRRKNIERYDPPCLLDEVVEVVPQSSDGLDPKRHFSVGHSSFPSDAASILLERIAVEKENRHRRRAHGERPGRRRFRVMGCATCGKGAWARPGCRSLCPPCATWRREWLRRRSAGVRTSSSSPPPTCRIMAAGRPRPAPCRHLLQRRAARARGVRGSGGLMECRGCGLTAWCSRRAASRTSARAPPALPPAPGRHGLLAGGEAPDGPQRTEKWHTEDEAAELSSCS